MKKPRTVAEFLRGASPAQRAALGKLRRDIRAAAPEAKEGIAYGVPAFRLGGRFLVAFGVAGRRCSFYPGIAVQGHASELARYDTSRGTVRFPPTKPPPAALVRKLVRARIARMGA